MNELKTSEKTASITLEVRFAETFFERLRGMIGRKDSPVLAFRSRFGMHTFGMRVPIDIAVLDPHGYVRKLHKNLPPGRVWFWNPRFSLLLELPSGTLDAHSIAVGAHITLVKKMRGSTHESLSSQKQ